MTPTGRRCALALILAIGASPLHAQWRAEASAGGVSHEALGTATAATTNSAILALGYEGPRWLSVSAGIPIGGDGVRWAAAGMGSRESMRRLQVDFGLEWSALVHAYDPSEGTGTATGATGTVLPFVATEIDALRLEARSGVVRYMSNFAGETTARSIHDSGFTAEIRPDARLLLAADARLLRADGGAYPFAGVSAELALPGGSVWGYGGTWSADVLPDPDWGVGGALDLGYGLSVRASYRQDATDPIYWNGTRRFWNLGVSRRFGPARATEFSAPVAPEMSRGAIVFRIPVESATTAPAVAGDFNGWSPVRMRRAGDDWIATLRVDPGVYHYAFQDEDGTWFVPRTLPNRVDDGFGGINAVLVIPERTSR